MKKYFIGFILVVMLSSIFTSCATSRGTRIGDCPSHDKNYFRR